MNTPPAPKIFQYGVFRGVSGSLVAFAVREGRNLPSNIIFVASTEGSARAHKLANEKLEELDTGISARPEGTRAIVEGSVCVHSDSEGYHSAVILQIDGGDDSYGETLAHALFLSSSRKWGTGRVATEDECMLLGLTPNRRTYLVLATRPLSEFYMRKSEIPEHRLKDFKKEFLRRQNGKTT